MRDVLLWNCEVYQKNLNARLVYVCMLSTVKFLSCGTCFGSSHCIKWKWFADRINVQTGNDFKVHILYAFSSFIGFVFQLLFWLHHFHLESNALSVEIFNANSNIDHDLLSRKCRIMSARPLCSSAKAKSNKLISIFTSGASKWKKAGHKRNVERIEREREQERASEKERDK